MDAMDAVTTVAVVTQSFFMHLMMQNRDVIVMLIAAAGPIFLPQAAARLPLLVQKIF
jgi:hypothetical protein